MRRELYINNILADIDNVSIPLNFACSEIGDLSGVSGNYSLTVKLPLTSNNIMIAYFANLPNTTPGSLWDGYRTTGSYFIDGIPIFQNADVKLLSTEKTIDVAITFGNLTWLDILENVKLKDIWTGPAISWNYWINLANEDGVAWLLLDYGGTFEGGIRIDRLHPAVHCGALWTEIWNYLRDIDVVGGDVDPIVDLVESDLYMPVISQVLNPALSAGVDFAANSNILVAPLDNSGIIHTNTVLNLFSVFDGVPDVEGVFFEVAASDKRLIFPKTGNYNIGGIIHINAFDIGINGSCVINITLREVSKGDNTETIVRKITLPHSQYEDHSFLINYEGKFEKGDVCLLMSFATYVYPNGDSQDVYITDISTFSAHYKLSQDKKEQAEFLMPFDVGYNLPDISCKDFVKAMLQLYGLMVENNTTPLASVPALFNLKDLPASGALDWSDKLVSFNRPKIEWNLGLKQYNYLRYVNDPTDNVIADAYFESYETDKSSKDIFVSMFAATEDITALGLDVCAIPLLEEDETEGWKYAGKCKNRIVRSVIDSAGYTVGIVQLYGEGYTAIYATEANSLLSWFQVYPAGIANTGQALNMAAIMDKYYGAYITAVKSNRLFTFEMLLNQIDINRFSHRTLIYIQRFANYYFVKKVLNWESGRTCNVEMLQLQLAGQELQWPTVVTFKKTFEVGEDDQIFEVGMIGTSLTYEDLALQVGNPISLTNVPYGMWTAYENLPFTGGFELVSIEPEIFELSEDNKRVNVVVTNKILPVIDTVKYGALYNWHSLTDARKISSSDDWTVPPGLTASLGTYKLWTTLGGGFVYPNYTGNVGGKLKETGLTYWNTPNTGAANSAKFNLRGAGGRSLGLFNSINLYSGIWTSTPHGSPTLAYEFDVLYNSAQCGPASGSSRKENGLSCRLVKESTTLSDGEEGIYTGNDGKLYRTICIGTQEWLADNLNETKYRNGDNIPVVTDNAAWVALTTGAMCYYDNDINNA